MSQVTIADVITAMRDDEEDNAILAEYPNIVQGLSVDTTPIPEQLGTIKVAVFLSYHLDKDVSLPLKFARAFRNRAIYLAMASVSAKATATTAIFACRRHS